MRVIFNLSTRGAELWAFEIIEPDTISTNIIKYRNCSATDLR